MARARNIKPGFFLNDELADVEPLGRLLFIGLWAIADREGRLEDRVKKIKAAVLPYDNCNVDKLLQSLQDKGFIMRYTVDGEGYIQVINFLKHQNPHMREQAGIIPAPDLHGACMVLAQEKHRTSPAESPSLIPESPSLIPESLKLIPEPNKTAIEIAVDDFKEFRKKTKAPMTDKAVDLLLSELNKLASDDETKIKIINQSIMNGWKGVFALKDDKPKKGLTLDPASEKQKELVRSLYITK